MANSRTRKPRRRVLWIVLVLGAIVAALWVYRAPIAGYSGVSTAYAARVACSCRFVGGRDLEDCEKDKLAGMELVTLVEDAEAKSVTARFPLISSTTASYREGYGCVLEKWER
ncbi:amiloride-sensitive sodium channel family protein [Leptolyngbya sp. 15MV]|nr:amiloride-sensitive sodium channel family protein [Leptolyngbya sp. 15MV]